MDGIDTARSTLGSYELFPLTDSGNAERMAAMYGDDLKYVKSWKEWLYWTGTHWARDEKDHIYLAARQTARSIRNDAVGVTPVPTETYGMISSWAYKSESEFRLRAMINLARSQKEFARMPSDFDRNHYLLNCTSGTLNLSAGKLYDHRRGDLITKCSPVECPTDFDEVNGANDTEWVKFLRVVVPDSNVREYLQRAVGYTLCGSVEEQCLFFLYGTGANGKTTFIETVKTLMGGYSVKVESRSIMSKGDKGGQATPNLARLFGARMACTTEIAEGSYINEALIKDITGGDTMIARHLYARLFEFSPTHKLWVCGNHKPLVKGTDIAIWRRFRLIPFTVSIPKDRQDRSLLDRLKGPGEQKEVLRWAIQGYMKWRKSGLGEPLGIEQATTGYRNEMDRIGAFVNDCCEIGIEVGETRVKGSILYVVYRDWCEGNGMSPLNSRRFGAALKTRGFEGKKVGGNYFRYGLSLKVGKWGNRD